MKVSNIRHTNLINNYVSSKKQNTSTLQDTPAYNERLKTRLVNNSITFRSIVINDVNRFRALNEAAANKITNEIFNNKLNGNSFLVAAQSTQELIPDVIYAIIENLKQRCTSLEHYKNALNKLLDGLNKALDMDFDTYESAEIVNNAINNSYYEFENRMNPVASSASLITVINDAEPDDMPTYDYINSYFGLSQNANQAINKNEAFLINTKPTPEPIAGTVNNVFNNTIFSDIDEVNIYLSDIAKKYVQGNTTSENSVIVFEKPKTNEYNENFYLNNFGNANEIFKMAVLQTRASNDEMDSILLKLIKSNDFDPNYRYSDGYNIGCRPIFILTTLNKPYLLQEALKLPSADPNLINGISQTALYRAVETNSLDCAYVLLKSGKINESELERCKNIYSMTTEMRGLLNSYPNIDEYIYSTFRSLKSLEKINIKTLDDVLRRPNVDVNFCDSNGNNILHIACMLPDKNESIRIASNALGNGVNINCVNKQGEVPIAVALKNNNYDLTAFLINKGADLSVFKDKLENTFAHTIISTIEEEEAIKLLDIAREKGFNMDTGNCNGITPLIQSVKLRKYRVIEYLLKNGILANKTDNFGRTALHYACILNDPSSLEILLNNFVNTKIKDNKGCLPCDYLKQENLINFYKMFDAMF